MREIEKEHFYIELLEDFKCENKKQLTNREGYFIREFKPVLNDRIEGRTKKQYQEDNKDKKIKYYQDNKARIKLYDKTKYENKRDTIRERQAIYYKNNNEQIKARVRELYKANKDTIKERYEANKDKINTRRREKYRLKKQQTQPPTIQ